MKTFEESAEAIKKPYVDLMMAAAGLMPGMKGVLSERGSKGVLTFLGVNKDSFVFQDEDGKIHRIPFGEITKLEN
jgi:hypothetical protein